MLIICTKNLDLIRDISDPEHPNSLEELHVVSAPQIKVKGNLVTVEFTPTVPHCGMSTLIGEAHYSISSHVLRYRRSDHSCTSDAKSADPIQSRYIREAGITSK